MMGLPPVTLVLGGARSGKSAFAETRVAGASPSRLYLATASAGDGEMAERIIRHQARRGDGWTTLEEPKDLAEALTREAQPHRPILVDCLTLWLTNLMMAEADIEADIEKLAQAVPAGGPVVFVSNEVGLGIVPDNKMARDFRDHAGRLHQKIAARADEVYFVAAGLPLKMKG